MTSQGGANTEINVNTDTASAVSQGSTAEGQSELASRSSGGTLKQNYMFTNSTVAGIAAEIARRPPRSDARNSSSPSRAQAIEPSKPAEGGRKRAPRKPHAGEAQASMSYKGYDIAHRNKRTSFGSNEKSDQGLVK